MLRKLLVAAFGCWLAGAQAQEIALRHALDGRALDALATLVVRFNGEQNGKGRVALQDLKGLAEADIQQPPHLALLDPDDSQRFFGTLPRFKPLFQVMAESKLKLEAKQFFPQMAAAADDLTGRIQGLPLAHALPVLLYNRDAFAKAGLDPEAPPKTWWEVQTAAGKLYDAGVKCPLTTSRFAWVHLDNISSQSGEPMLVRDGKKDRVALNTLVHVKHIALLTSWHKSEYFHYFGPNREGDAQFAAGKCAMLTGESTLYAELGKTVPFAVGIAELPYYDDVRGARAADVLPDGAALWALPGKGKDDYKLAARFVEFLLRPAVQAEWVRATGFLPMTPAALDALKATGAVPALLDRARARLAMPTRLAERIKHGNGRSRIRGILNEEIEFVWGDKKPAKEALDTAMRRVGESVEMTPLPEQRGARR